MRHLPRSNGAGASPPRPDLRREFRQWAGMVWSDILTLSALGAIALGLHHVPVAARRTFPVTFNASGDIVYPEMAYPNRGWIIDTWLSGVLSALVPVFIILLMQFRVRNLWDATCAITGLLYADTTATIFQVVVKKLVGGFRPYFLSVCQPDISLAKGGPGSLDASGFQQIMYTVDICTTTDKKKLDTAMTSFPSGHAVAAFAGYGFLFLYMNGKLKVWADHKPQMWKVSVLFLPLLGAFLIACSLSIDAAHNWYDIAVGIIIGTVFAFASYRMSFAAIWDWRFNHVPLRRKEFKYVVDRHARHGVFTRSAGWGMGYAVSEKGPDDASVASGTIIPHGPRRPMRGEEMV